MLHLLPAWRGRRVLLAGGKSGISCAMQSLLEEIGARPVRTDYPCSSEALCRTLNASRGILVIVPCLRELTVLPPPAQLDALHTLLREAREAGTPLVMLLAGQDVPAHQAHMLSRLVRCASDYSSGLYGDTVSVQGILHASMPERDICLGALALGARYLQGDLTCTGIFTLSRSTKE